MEKLTNISTLLSIITLVPSFVKISQFFLLFWWWFSFSILPLSLCNNQPDFTRDIRPLHFTLFSFFAILSFKLWWSLTTHFLTISTQFHPLTHSFTHTHTHTSLKSSMKKDSTFNFDHCTNFHFFVCWSSFLFRFALTPFSFQLLCVILPLLTLPLHTPSVSLPWVLPFSFCIYKSLNNISITDLSCIK